MVGIPPTVRRRVDRAALRDRLRLCRRRPARDLPEGSDLALLAALLHRPAPLRLAAGAALPDRLGGDPARGADRPRDHAAGARPPRGRAASSIHRRRRAPCADLARRGDRLATVLCVAIPIKIWNSARIEHRLQEQEKLLMAARVAGARQPDQPALPVQHADVDLVADPVAAGDGADADREAVGPAAPAAAQPGALRHAARGARGDRRVPRHREHPLRAASCAIEKSIDPASARRRRAEHAAAAAGRELDQARPVAEDRRRTASRSAARAQDGHAIIDVIDNGVGVDAAHAEPSRDRAAASACRTSTSACA